ncbi:SH3-like domain-containing protein [Lactobacillus sp. M0345]|uniref:GH25 family lysozyme n=1 Tax=Apilactobacillus kunkeei TaxID=148814 RepID=UPI000B0A6F69|nr:GH25 family lysozyme [Apilactobacillus kunkeei]MBI0091967.1 SH3-like domain-containing protein [Lactobacillus sp. M0345]
MRKKGLWFSIVAVIGLMLASTSVPAMADASNANTSNTVYDMSEWQGSLTDTQAQQLKNEVPFVILRVQYGSAYADKTFEHNRDLMDKYGIPYGVYSFSQYENPSDAAYEAKVLYSRAPRARFYVNDYESQTVTSGGTNESTDAWLKALRPLVGQRKILFYSYANFMVQNAASSVANYDGYWLAAYQNNEPAREHVLWQFTDKFHSNALGKNLDASMFTSKDANWFIGDVADATNPAPIPKIKAPKSDQSSKKVNKKQSAAQKNAASQANQQAANTNNNNNNTNNNNTSSTTTKPKKKAVVKNVDYTAVDKSMTIAGGTGLKIYNHVPGDNRYKKNTKAVHKSNSYATKRVTINSVAKNTSNGRTYYRVLQNGKVLGWINTNGLVSNVTYSKYHATKIVRMHPKVNFYNHVGNSGFADIHVTNYGTGYAYTPVQITQRAKKDGWKKYYYKAYYQGKFIGWAYGAMFK